MEGNIIINTMKMEAINFAEWIAKNGIKPSCAEGMWLIPENDNEFEDIKKRIASSDLYEMFLEAERRRIEMNTPKLQLPLADVSGAICGCERDYVCGLCYKQKGYKVVDGKLQTDH